MLKELYQERQLIGVLVANDFRARYAGSALGLLWSVIQPLFMIVVYVLIFSVILKIKIGSQGGLISFGTWLVCGMVPWLMVQSTLSRSSTAITDRARLLRQFPLHPSSIPFSLVLVELLQMLIALVLFVALLFCLRLPVGICGFGLLLLLPFQVLFCLGLATLLSCLNVFVRDVAQLVGPLSTIWFFATPIVYPIEMAPPWLQAALHANPLTGLVDAYRSALMQDRIPAMLPLCYFAAASMAVYLAGKIVYRRTRQHIHDGL